MEFDLAHLKQEISKAYQSGEIELPSVPNLLHQLISGYQGKHGTHAAGKATA